MPELPEVETIINDLNKKVLDLEIKNIQIKKPKIVKNSNKKFVDFLLANKFKKIVRRGKLIIFSFNDKDEFMLVHLRMTGQLIYKYQSSQGGRKRDKIIAGGHSQEKTLDNLPNKYTHVIFTFKNKTQLMYNDLRQFGYLQLVDKKELDEILNKFGYEPLEKEFNLRNFKKLTKGSKRNIKAFLLDQSLIAGIGNIYADEVLFASSVHPKRSVDTLSDNEQKKIHSNIKKILRKAVRYRGTTFNDYLDADGNKGGFGKMLKIYGRNGKACLECGSIIKKTKVAGRGTRHCRKCQPK
jgi:formamidopyrimidine-DNA glycosylase